MLSSSAYVPPPSATGLEVRPFRALTYRRHDPEHLARVSSPAYDLVTPSGRERLAAADPYNIVRLILPRVDPAPGSSPSGDGNADPGGSAEQAGTALRRWEDDGVLDRDERPALWLYEMQPPAGPATRGWLGAVALPGVGSRAVLPHEDTYPGAVEGRRALLAATRTDLEPIVLAHDPEPSVGAMADRVRTTRPTLLLTDGDGVRHRLWRVSDEEILSTVTGHLSRTQAVIADGHHRFAAARAHHARCSDAPGSDAVLALLTPMGAGGLRVEAIHRVVPDLPLEHAADLAAGGFRVDEIVGAGAGREDVAATISAWAARPDGFGVLLTDGRRVLQLSHPSGQMLATVPQEAPAAWRGLDVVLVHSALLEGLWQRGDDPASVLVAHDVEEALRTARSRDGVAVLLHPPSPGAVAAVARAGARMPRKSTLFVPKPRTGLVLRPHED